MNPGRAAGFRQVRAAIGIRVHSGWAVAVAAGAGGGAAEFLGRACIPMADGASPGGRQPYHAAEGMPFAAAARLIEAASAAAQANAARAVMEFATAIARDCEIAGAVILASSARALADLQSVLGSHAAIHAAEGELFR
ncbi:MAG: hypothetical protein JO041_04820, partial [Acidobacteria bacterium]|nr:hypothetical protein [Acidobacteriota bacterium]